MKKLRLKALELGAKELLTRDQLKNIRGGSDVGNDMRLCYCYTLGQTGYQWIDNTGRPCAVLNQEAWETCVEMEYEGGDCCR